MTREKQENRTKRVPLGVPRLTLNVDEGTKEKYKGMVLRWINDTGTRLMDAHNAGYEFVTGGRNAVAVGDAKSAQAQDQNIRQQVGTTDAGQPLYAYLMAIKQEFYEQDQAEKEKANQMVDDAINGGNPKGLEHHGVKPEHGGSYLGNINYKP